MFQCMFFHHVDVGQVEGVGADHGVFEIAFIQQSYLDLGAFYVFHGLEERSKGVNILPDS